MSFSKKVKIVKPVPDSRLLVGSEITVPTDKNGIPLDFFWRKVFKDAKLDHCIEFCEKENSIETEKWASDSDVSPNQLLDVD